MTTDRSRRRFFGTAAAAAAWPLLSRVASAASAAPAAGGGGRLKLGVASYSMREVHARPGARHGQDAGRDAHDVQGRPHPAHRSAGDDARAAREDRGGRHHDHGRRHDHDAERSGADQEGIRVREERRLPADLTSTRIRRRSTPSSRWRRATTSRSPSTTTAPRTSAGRARRTPTPP